MRISMCFGTFDNFHPGHQSYLKQASCSSLPLLVVVARDKTIQTSKGKSAQENEEIRQRKVIKKMKELSIDGKVILGGLKDKWIVVRKYKPEIICLGYDQKVDLKKLKTVITQEKFICKIRRLKAYHPDRYKSSYCRK